MAVDGRYVNLVQLLVDIIAYDIAALPVFLYGNGNWQTSSLVWTGLRIRVAEGVLLT